MCSSPSRACRSPYLTLAVSRFCRMRASEHAGPTAYIFREARLSAPLRRSQAHKWRAMCMRECGAGEMCQMCRKMHRGDTAKTKYVMNPTALVECVPSSLERAGQTGALQAVIAPWSTIAGLTVSLLEVRYCRALYKTDCRCSASAFAMNGSGCYGETTSWVSCHGEP